MDTLIAAAVGCGLPVERPEATMIMVCGAAATQVAVLSLGSIVRAERIPVGGEAVDAAIVQHLRHQHQLMLPSQSVRPLQLALEGNGLTPEGPEVTEIHGRDVATGLARSVKVDTAAVRRAIQTPLTAVLDGIGKVLRDCPPDLVADLADRGIMMVGGSALLPGLDQMLRQATGMPVHIAEQPELCAVEGLGAMLEGRITLWCWTRSAPEPHLDPPSLLPGPVRIRAGGPARVPGRSRPFQRSGVYRGPGWAGASAAQQYRAQPLVRVPAAAGAAGTARPATHEHRQGGDMTSAASFPRDGRTPWSSAVAWTRTGRCSPRGELVRGCAQLLAGKLAELPAGTARVDLDMSGVHFMDTAGLQFLEVLREHARRRSMPVTTCRWSGQPRRILELAGLDTTDPLRSPRRALAGRVGGGAGARGAAASAPGGGRAAAAGHRVPPGHRPGARHPDGDVRLLLGRGVAHPAGGVAAVQHQAAHRGRVADGVRGGGGHSPPPEVRTALARALARRAAR